MAFSNPPASQAQLFYVYPTLLFHSIVVWHLGRGSLIHRTHNYNELQHLWQTMKQTGFLAAHFLLLCQTLQESIPGHVANNNLEWISLITVLCFSFKCGSFFDYLGCSWPITLSCHSFNWASLLMWVDSSFNNLDWDWSTTLLFRFCKLASFLLRLDCTSSSSGWAFFLRGTPTVG